MKTQKQTQATRYEVVVILGDGPISQARQGYRTVEEALAAVRRANRAGFQRIVMLDTAAGQTC